MRKQSLQIDIKNIKKNVVESIRSLAMNISRDLIRRTPVDVGKAKSNWQITYHKPVGLLINAHFPGKWGSTRVENIVRATALAQVALRSYKANNTIYISNSADYITYLNMGSSPQAPKNYINFIVSDNIEAFNSKFKKARK